MSSGVYVSLEPWSCEYAIKDNPLEVCNLVTNKQDVRVFRRFRSFQIHLRFCLATV